VVCAVLLIIPCLLYGHLLGAPRLLPKGTLHSWGEYLGQAVASLVQSFGSGADQQPATTITPGSGIEDGDDSSNSTEGSCDGEPLSWLLEKRRRCCQQENRGCSSAYDCNHDRETWQATWSEEKQHFCCGFDLTGCSTTTTAISTTAASDSSGATTPAGGTHKCEVDLEHWLSKWSPAKKAYCCAVFNTGCEVTTTSGKYDCGAELANWRSAWGEAKKSWCCRHENTGCEGEAEGEAPAQSPAVAPATGCQALCSIDGVSATCRDRINWIIHEPPPKGVFGQPIKCQSALSVVIKDCHVCSTCSLAETECGSPDSDDEESYECSGGGHESWHAARSSWCCIVQGIACPSGVSPGNFECVTEESDWGQIKKDWCCTHAKIGCREQ